MRPSIQSLAQAKSIIVQTQMRVTRLIQKIAFGGGGGGGGGGGDQCSRLMTRRNCVAAGCSWNGQSCFATSEQPDGSYPPGWEGDQPPALTEDVLENDVAANFALQGLGHGLGLLANDIDYATATYALPEFWVHWGQACSRASFLLGANQAAKVSANLPPPGFVTAADFTPIDVELLQVKSLLMCP
jgi:hypothetical protein